jgi:CBS domain-containing protein
MTTEHPAPQAKDFMNRQIQTVSPDMPLADVVSFLLKHGISNAPVVETSGNEKLLAGFISERDCLEFLANEAFYGSPAAPQTVRTMMRMHPVCVAPETELFTLANIFVHHGYRHLPVVENNHLLGLVSRRDILQALDDYYRQKLQERDQQRNPPDVHELIHHRFLLGGR